MWEARLDVYLSCLAGFEPDIWEISGGYLGISGGYLGDIWVISGGYLGDIRKYYRDILRYRTLIWPRDLAELTEEDYKKII